MPRVRSQTSLVLLPLLVLIVGCPPAKPVYPTSRYEALSRVNDNLSRIEEPLRYKAFASFKFRDADGKIHRYPLQDSNLLFMPEQSLLFDVRSLAGTLAQFGSNDEKYWVWLDVPDVRKLWHGSWDQIQTAGARQLVIPPNELLDALMLRPLSPTVEGGLEPVLRRTDDDCRLIYWRVGPGGQTRGMREIVYDREEPGQPVEIIDRLPDGDVAMRALLENYKPIGRDGPLTPHRYEIEWPRDGARITLRILSSKFRPDLEPEDVFEFPEGWQGESESLDERGLPSANEAEAVQTQ